MKWIDYECWEFCRRRDKYIHNGIWEEPINYIREWSKSGRLSKY